MVISWFCGLIVFLIHLPLFLQKTLPCLNLLFHSKGHPHTSKYINQFIVLYGRWDKYFNSAWYLQTTLNQRWDTISCSKCSKNSRTSIKQKFNCSRIFHWKVSNSCFWVFVHYFDGKDVEQIIFFVRNLMFAILQVANTVDISGILLLLKHIRKVLTFWTMSDLTWLKLANEWNQKHDTTSYLPYF